MLEPYAALSAPDFSLGGDDEGMPFGWSAELIASLDWLRLAELARAIASNAGCELGGSRVFEDGSVIFAMVEQPQSPKPRKALVKIVSWNEWSATPQTVEAFVRELRTARNARGIFVAPGGFTNAALHAASEHGIETVDAARLAATLKSLPAEQSDFFHVITTAGDFAAPSCPVCLGKLTRHSSSAASDLAAPASEYIFQASAIVADPILCRRLEVRPNCEVQFLHEVRAAEIVIHGHVTGDLVCEGPLHLEDGATLNGTVAARAVNVHHGAELLGQARILEGELQPVMSAKPRSFWLCDNPLGKAACKAVMFDVHE